MNILHVIASCSSGGAEVFVRDLAIQQQRAGHSTAVAHISDKASASPEQGFEFEFERELLRNQVATFPLGIRSRRNLPLGAFRLWRAIRKTRADIVHVHLGRAVLLRLLVPVMLPTVFTYHTSIARYDLRFFKLFDKVVSRYIAICAPAEEFLKGVTTREVITIQNGIPGARVVFQGYREASDSLRVICVGNLRKEKNYGAIVESAWLLRQQLGIDAQRVHFTIVGEGEERAMLERQIHEKNVGDLVTLLGRRSDVAGLMADSDVLVMSSSFEGLPITLIEALFSGLPIIATDVGGVSEVVQDNENGLLVDPGDPKHIADAIMRFLDDSSLLARFSRSARKSAEDFSIHSCYEKYLAVYQNLVPKRNY